MSIEYNTILYYNYRKAWKGYTTRKAKSMEKITRKITNTVINVGLMKMDKKGGVTIEKMPPIEVIGRKVGKDAAARYVLKEYRSSDYIVLGVEHTEKEYKVSVENFIKACEQEG